MNSTGDRADKGAEMETAISRDGTQIAFDRTGQGPAVILVSGALGHRAFDQSMGEVARRLAEHFTVLHYDRRGRGDSGDTPPYAVERELEDLEALLAEAGGSASLYGSSSGGNLALKAAREGLPVTKLALWEPNFLVDRSRPSLPDDYVTELEERVADGRRGDAVEYFMTTAVGLPAEFVAPMREMPMWPGMEAVAHTLAYDGRIVDGFELPTAELEALDTPGLVMAGGQTPWLLSGAQALARALPVGEFRVLEGQGHDVAADAVAPELVEFFAVAHEPARR
jgi:pimeloyl-ACP methyl ester carboxylesterase